MRISFVTALVVLFFSCTGLASSPRQTVLDLSITTSRVPQFILDTKHPWLAQNKIWLDSLDDPEQALCMLDSKIRPGHNNTLTYPADLFRRLEVNNNVAGHWRGNWNNAVARLGEILKCPAALQDVEDFKTEMRVFYGRHGKGVKEPRAPPAELPALFIDTLKAMPRLTKLDWNTWGHGVNELCTSFIDSNLTLPSIRHLRLSKFMDCIIAVCPNVEVLKSRELFDAYDPCPNNNSAMRFIESAQNAHKVTNFNLITVWELEHLQALSRAIPNITSLEIDGHIEPSYDVKVLNDDETAKLELFAPVLSQFPHLEHLYLPHSAELGLGFYGGHWCGNAYDGASGRAYGRQVVKGDVDATEKAAEILGPIIAKLKSFRVGDYQATITRNESGQVELSWPWTGRTTEWIYKDFPE